MEVIARNAGTLLAGLRDHLILTGLAVGVGLVLSLGLALLIYRERRLTGPIVAVTGTLYTIPSLALFAFLVPFTRLSVLTAEIGLVSAFQRLFRVELPLAVPLIIAGIRVATVTTIGLVMVTAEIGQGGLGQVLLRGFRLQQWPLVYAALVAMVVLAIAADGLLALVGRLVTPWSRTAARR